MKFTPVNASGIPERLSKRQPVEATRNAGAKFSNTPTASKTTEQTTSQTTHICF
jgi:hypothetical protein